MEWTENEVDGNYFTAEECDKFGRGVSGYGIYMTVACTEYKELETEDKMELIERIVGECCYTTQMSANGLARRVWINMPYALQEKWKE